MTTTRIIGSASPKSIARGGSWLEKLIHPLDLASLVRDPDGTKATPRHNSRESLISAYRSEQYGRVERWTRGKVDAHATGDKTYFYTTDAAKQIGLIGIDVDCHGSGSAADALNLCRWLRDNHFSEMHFEASTSGSGGHGYLIIDWGVTPREKILARLREFERWLNEVATAEGFDIEMVEVCGTPTQSFWGAGRNELVDIQFGQLFKLPRNIEACESTTQIKLRDLPRSRAAARTQIVQVDQWPNPKTPKQRGSSTGKHITRESIERFMEIARGILHDFVPTVACNKSLTIAPEHVATFLAIEEFFRSRPNSDGSNPTARMRALWRACYADGTAKAQHHPSIVAAIRNTLADAGLVSMVDRHYSYCPGAERGKGIAMKWKVDSETIAAYRQILTGNFETDGPPNMSLVVIDQDESVTTRSNKGQREILGITSHPINPLMRPKWVPMHEILLATPPPQTKAA